MSLIALCSRRLLTLQISAASDAAALIWRTPQTNAVVFRQRVSTEQPRFALITQDYLQDAPLFTDLRAGSPETLLIVCLEISSVMTKPLWKLLDNLEFDVLCTVPELTDCLVTLKAGRFFQSTLLQTAATYSINEPFPGWHSLSPAERRVLRGIAAGQTGPQIADTECLSQKTVNNHKLKISQKLGISGGPGSLTRWVMAHRETLLHLLAD
ncbi:MULTISPECIES: helix-turn-helix transcriptional regulator [Spirosoma]|uniref:LuxR family transcriptional regulator n=1 Tax=Spirosoma sordidisoli TaxID=2502893 RepID=A0A4Q2UQP0_9BACT|nr:MULTISPECIES: LuxR family transcriptional regulator [Spirosoma]RYC71854.1 LuxR family transcriptional regulator [Spirosoma sordidisoli]